MFYLDKYFIK